MKEFVEPRFPSISQHQQDGSSEVRFWDTMYKNNAPTINNLCQVAKSSKEKNKTIILRAHRNVLQRLITAYETRAKMTSTVCWNIGQCCTSRFSRDEWQSQNFEEISLSRLNYKWNKLPKWNRASRQLMSINRWSGISFCSWETICHSKVWGLCR